MKKSLISARPAVAVPPATIVAFPLGGAIAAPTRIATRTSAVAPGGAIAAPVVLPAAVRARTKTKRNSFRAAALAELPAFLCWLLYEFKIPFSPSEHAPGPHVRLWELIVRSRVVFYEHRGGGSRPARWVTRKEGWRGSAGDLAELLKSDPSQLSKAERDQIQASAWLGRALKACEMNFGSAYCHLHRTAEGRRWVLQPRKEDASA